MACLAFCITHPQRNDSMSRVSREDLDESNRIDAMMRRMGEIEAMAGREMPHREVIRLLIEHGQLTIAIPAAESRRLRIKAAQMEAEERKRQCAQ